MATPFRFDPIELPPACEALRQEVRAFIKAELAKWAPIIKVSGAVVN